MSDWYLNGEPTRNIAIDSRGLQYGDGAFETIAVRRGSPRLWDMHIDRLTRTCSRLNMTVPNLDDCFARIEQHQEPYGTAKLIVSAKGEKRGYARESSEADVLLRVFHSRPLPIEMYRDGIDVVLCETCLATGSPLAGLKTLNRLEQVLARNEVVAAGCFEGLTRDADDNLICGTMSNLFAVTGDKIVTPGLSRCGVEGVMRQNILNVLADSPFTVETGTIQSLDDVEELFLSNSQFGILPVRSCGDVDWPVGESTRAVMKLLAESGIEECRL